MKFEIGRVQNSAVLRVQPDYPDAETEEVLCQESGYLPRVSAYPDCGFEGCRSDREAWLKAKDKFEKKKP